MYFLSKSAIIVNNIGSSVDKYTSFIKKGKISNAHQKYF